MFTVTSCNTTAPTVVQSNFTEKEYAIAANTTTFALNNRSWQSINAYRKPINGVKVFERGLGKTFSQKVFPK